MSGDIPSQIKQTISAADMKQFFTAEALETAKEVVAQQAVTDENLQNVYEEMANPMVATFKKRQKPKSELKIRVQKTQKERVERRLVSAQEAQKYAKQAAEQNPELKEQTLLLLMEKANNTNSKEELLQLLEQFYPDPSLADDALKFLEKTATGSLKKIVQEAQELHGEKHGREISAGKNIAEEVQRYAEAGLGLPTSLRDMYRDITGRPREPLQLFQELSGKFAYKELRKVLAFLFHSLGSDLKAQGPSIPRGLLHQLLSGVRSLQGILGVYQFFRARMKLINFLFKREGLELPKNLNFENIAKQFVNLLQERYPTGDKVLQMAGKLGIDKWILAKIIVFSQLRDAIRQIALSQFYRNVEHRDELYKAIIEALENLEEELDAIREEEEEAYERREAGEDEEERDEEQESEKQEIEDQEEKGT